MKKIILLLSILLFPLNVLAYSDYVYVGGKTLGIDINCDGILIVGFYQINGEYNKGELKVGDYITKVEDISINSLTELSNEIEKKSQNEFINIEYRRDNKLYKTTLKLVKDNGIYKTGLYVKDNIIGIGTLTYIDPETNIYGALGHEITNGNNKKVEIKDGNIFENRIVSIQKSSLGHAGSKNAKYYYNNVYGDIKKNTNHGIFGTIINTIDDLILIEVGDSKDIHLGKASIYTVLENDKMEEFTIDIKSINYNADTKNIIFEITDQELLAKTGGVIQGMSGSPIIQDNKLVGAVTHVVVDNPTKGYGLIITKMLEEGEK